MSRSLALPTLQQNWSCGGCSKCCRQHAIFVTDAERERILSQGWSLRDVFIREGSRYRLAHGEDGACVFLDEHNRCRIHAKYGANAKPLACRVFPFAFVPAGDRIAVNLRFSCPAVASDDGARLKSQMADLHALRDLAVPKEATHATPPAVSTNWTLDWPDTLRITKRLHDLAIDGSYRLPLRLIHGLFVADMLSKASFDKVRGSRIDELMDVLIDNAPTETVRSLDEVPAPSPPAQTQFRLMVAQYARRDAIQDRRWRYRLAMVLAGVQMTRGKGFTPPMQPALPAVRFDVFDASLGPAAKMADLQLRRYFDVKLSSLAYCGRAAHNLPIFQGFQRLALMYPILIYLAKWTAAFHDRKQVTEQDVQAATTSADHHFGYSPAMAGASFGQRFDWLVKHHQLAPLIAELAK